MDQSRITLLTAAQAAALADLPEAASINDRLTREHPEDTLCVQVWGSCARARTALNVHNPKGALAALNGSEPYDFISPGPYLRGCAYLELKDGPHAVERFKKPPRIAGRP